jgi:hypothetical protein
MVGWIGRGLVRALLASVCVVTLCGQEGRPEEDGRLHSAGNAQFEIVGLDARSVSYVDDLSRHVVQVAARYLDADGLQFPQRILVKLKPEKYVDFEGVSIVRIQERGFVNLDLRWEAPLTLLQTCRALSRALLVRYSIFNYGKEGPSVLPNWPADAIGITAYLALRPAQARQLGDWLDIQATPTVAGLLARKWSDPVTDANAYGLLWAMQQSGIERKTVRSLMAQSISGVDISEALASQVQLGRPMEESVPLDAWWQLSLAQLLKPAGEVMETMETSRLWIDSLADLSNTEFKDLGLNDLWDKREDAALRGLIEARYEILRLRIVRVNPAYFNAARSLGALFENYLSGERRHKYLHSLTGFLGDFQDAKELEEKVVEALGKTAAKNRSE